MPVPEVLGRNGTYIVFRKLHTRVAAYRQYLRARAASRAEEDQLGAKMVGRWQSGAPLALCPEHDDPILGADPGRNNDFSYADDPRGFKCPAGAHARRANPRAAHDGEGSVDVRLHRMIRRGTSYGPELPPGVLEDDGADRGIIFVFAGAHLRRQFEFVKTQWLNDGIFIGAPTAVQAVKRAVRMGEGQPIEQAIAIMMEEHWRSAVHPDRAEGIGAFNEGREPSFADPDY
jgi:Dyp-type peroxidase family